jgi:4-hydroxyphenylpyruvate dioxygenase
MSLGRAWVRSLQTKLDQASAEHFQGVEIFYEDLEYLAKSLPGGVTDNSILEAAKQIHTMCVERHLEIIGLQPFLHYEGLLDREEHQKRIEKLKLWLQIVKVLNTDIIQIPTNFLSAEITGDRDVIVADMREAAELGLKESPVVRFAYENICWGTFIDTWEGAWDVVAAVDKPNFGMCLDTFNIAGREWANPASPDGKIVGEDADAALKRSSEKMVKTIDVERVFYVQVVDVEKMRSPLVEGHPFYVEGQPARMSWSRNARLFAFEEGGYLLVLSVLKAITELEGLGY